jgi:lipopolysaccharide transport system permease protein
MALSDTEAMAPPELAGATPHVIDARRSWGIDLRELWEYRELFFFLVWRDIKVRYAQTVLGAGWAILQPVLTMVVFTVIFGNVAKIASDGVPYAVFSLAAVVPWTYFSKALAGSSTSLTASVNLITKVYFPRLVIPLAPVIAGLVDLAIAFVILLGVTFAFGFVPTTLALVALPLAVLAALMTAAGVGFWMAALNIQYRDVKYIVPFMVQIWMYVSPVIYSYSAVPDRYRLLYALNPMVGVIEAFRSTLVGTSEWSPQLTGMALLMGLLLMVTGAFYFRRTERIFADVA